LTGLLKTYYITALRAVTQIPIIESSGFWIRIIIFRKRKLVSKIID